MTALFLYAPIMTKIILLILFPFSLISEPDKIYKGKILAVADITDVYIEFVVSTDEEIMFVREYGFRWSGYRGFTTGQDVLIYSCSTLLLEHIPGSDLAKKHEIRALKNGRCD